MTIKPKDSCELVLFLFIRVQQSLETLPPAANETEPLRKRMDNIQAMFSIQAKTQLLVDITTNIFKP